MLLLVVLCPVVCGSFLAPDSITTDKSMHMLCPAFSSEYHCQQDHRMFHDRFLCNGMSAADHSERTADRHHETGTLKSGWLLYQSGSIPLCLNRIGRYRSSRSRGSNLSNRKRPSKVCQIRPCMHACMGSCISGRCRMGYIR